MDWRPERGNRRMEKPRKRYQMNTLETGFMT